MEYTEPTLSTFIKSRNLIHECKITLRFLGILLRVVKLEVSKQNVYITNQFQTTFVQWGVGGGEGLNLLVEVTLRTFVSITSKNSVSKSENSQYYAQKPQRNCTFMNSAL
jgi:hypothetical protein